MEQTSDALSTSLAEGSQPASPHEHIQSETANESSLHPAQLTSAVGLDAVDKLRLLAPEGTLTILNPRSPIEAGVFHARHVSSDRNTLITALNIGRNRTRYVYIDLNETSKIKLLSEIQIIRNPAAVRKTIILVPENRVENMKKFFENLSSNANNLTEQYEYIYPILAQSPFLARWALDPFRSALARLFMSTVFLISFIS